ncbi:MAG: hypothetical protein ACREYE_27280 [Gammaproteobacteria bacterium]
MNRSQWRLAADRLLLGLRHRSARQTREPGDRLLLEQLLRRQDQTGLPRPANRLNLSAFIRLALARNGLLLRPVLMS